MQIIVLGMHRAGTSVVTRLINLMGAYFGAEDVGMEAKNDNPKGFWERRDVFDLCNAILSSAAATWHTVHQFKTEAVPEEARERFDSEIARIVKGLDAHRPWVLKDPRLCLLFPLWQSYLEVPVCVLPYRCPLQVAHSLKARNGFPLTFGVALWERYVRDSLASSAGLPRFLVTYEEVMANPVEATRNLHQQLADLGVGGLRLPDRREVLSFVDPDLHRQRQEAETRDAMLNPAQRELFRSLADGSALAIEEIPPLSSAAQEILEIHGEIQARKAELERTRERSRSQAAELEAARGEIGDRQAELERMREEIRSQAAGLEAASAELRDRQAELERTPEEVRSQAAELEAVRDEIRGRQAEFERTREENRSQAAELEALRQRYQVHLAELEQAQEENRSQSAELEVQRQDLEQAREENRALTAEFDALRNELERVQGENRTQAAELDRERRQRAQSVTRLEATQARLRQELDALRGAPQKIAKLKARLQDLQDAYERRTDKYHKLEKASRAKQKELREVLSAIESSRSWRIAQTVSFLFNLLTFRWDRLGAFRRSGRKPPTGG